MAPNEGRGPSRAPAARVHPLPLSIAVRNLFPPLAPPADGDATTAASGGGGSGPSSSSSAAEAEVDGSSPIRASAPAEEEGEGARRGDRPGVEASSRNPSRRRSRIESLSSKISSSSVEERCALVSREVLLRLRLDVVRKPSPSSPSRSGDGAEEADDEKAEGGVSTTAQRETLVYSSEQARSTAHPRWDHLNERLPSSRSALGSLSDVYARFVIADGAEDSSALPAAAEENVGYGRVLAEIPLHPSQLRRLPPTATAGASDYGQKSSGGAMGVPHSLPPNTVLIHYDDGYTRVVPNVYWLLVQRGVIDESVTDPIKRNGSRGYAGIKSEGSNDGEDGGGPSLFEDKAFSVLGEPSASASATGAPPIGADSGEPHDGDGHADGGAQSTLVDDKVFDLLGEAAPATAHVKHAEATPQRSSDKNDESAFDDRILDLLGASAKDVESKEEMAVGVPIETSRDDPPELTAEANKDADAGEAAVDERTSMNLSEEQRKENQEARPEESSALQPVPELPSPPTIDSSEGTRKSQRDEIEELRRLVQLEELMLEEEERQAVQGTNHLKSIMQQVQQIEHDTSEIMKAVGAERANLFRSEFRLEAHRIYLLQHLQIIFPIKLVPINISVNPPNFPQHQYTIAGLPIPDDIHNPTATDDQVSAALGFLCHLVSLTSKYLAIPLRYTLICKFSRSAVLFDHGRDQAMRDIRLASKVVYPLFRERGVIDREQLDYGLLLLERNVDCLCSMRGVKVGPEWNVLAKMDKLLIQVIDGEDPSFGRSAG